MAKVKQIGSSHKVPQSSYGAKFIRSMGGQFNKKMKRIIKNNMNMIGINRGRIKM